MTATEYQTQAYKTLAKSEAENISYLVFGLKAKAAELANKLETAVRLGEIEININNEVIFTRVNSSRFTDNLVDELGDVLWFVAMVAWRLGFSLEEVMRRNLDKLADRQSRGVIIGDGDKR